MLNVECCIFMKSAVKIFNYTHAADAHARVHKPHPVLLRVANDFYPRPQYNNINGFVSTYN